MGVMMDILRYLSYLYLTVVNMIQLLCPSTLSYDWQLGSLPLVDSLLDIRNILTAMMTILAIAIILAYRRVNTILTK